jgi:hypothetical protein
VSATRTSWILLLCLFLISLPAVTPRIYSSDEIQYFAYLRSLWFDHDVSFENEYRYFYDRGIARSEGFHETFLERTTPTGRRINFGTIGCAILWAPFYAAGDVAARLMRSGGRSIAVDGLSTPYVAAVAYGSAFYAAAALALAILAARRLRLQAFGAALAVWLGTPLLFYMYIAPPMSHACSAFAVALFVYAWLHVRDSWSIRGAAALGAAGGLMAIVREQDVFLCAGPALDFVLWLSTSYRRGSVRPADLVERVIAPIAAAATAFGVVFVPQALAYAALNGRVGPSPLVTRKMNWVAPHALEVLFSPAHGFFVWTPLAAMAIVGLVLMAVRALPDGDRRRVALCMLLMAGLQIYVSGSVESWTVAGGFGQRRFVALTALLVIGTAALLAFPRGRSGRRAVTAAIVVAAYWNIALTVEFAVGLMDRQKMSPGQNAYHAFVTLPTELPSLAYRYLFNRSSFYQPKTTGPDGAPPVSR